jgi:excinuclease ABC subunit C
MVSQELKTKLRDVPHQPGVYIMKDRLGSIIYVGKAIDLKRRVSSYFVPSGKNRASLKTRALMDSIYDFEFHIVRNDEESMILEGKLIKDYRPRYNIAFKDDKRFLHARVRLTDTAPRLSYVRSKKEDNARYFGPFPHSSALIETINWLNRRLGLRVCRAANPGEKDYKHCNADIIRNCSAPCIGRISKEDYLEKIQEACLILEGKGKKALFDELEDEMQAASEVLDFEKAATFRDIIANLKKTLTPTRQFARGRGVPTTVKPTEDLADLGEALGLSAPPRIMECFDISNVSSNHIVASMVRFTNGHPDNQNYRRYRIQTVTGQDDFASMAEVVMRRYSRILRENTSEENEHSQESLIDQQRRLAKDGKAKIILPDLVIVDGGKGQLSSAFKQLRALGLQELPIIGLAKQHEEVFFPGQSEPLLIPHDRGALKLLQRIRDEAHRFANGYNELLYRRRMKESALDDCPGMSPRRKALLLEKFGSVTRIRKATPMQIAKIPGISENFAQSLLVFLNQG